MLSLHAIIINVMHKNVKIFVESIVEVLLKVLLRILAFRSSYLLTTQNRSNPSEATGKSRA